MSVGEETNTQLGEISGRISPDDVHITILVKIAGTSPENDYQKFLTSSDTFYKVRYQTLMPEVRRWP